MKVTVTVEFDGPAAAQQMLARLGSDGTIKTVQTETLQQHVEAKPAVLQAETAAAAGPTVQEVNKAFTDYVGRGGGRTAMTAKEILAQHGAKSVREATPEQLAALKTAFETA